MKIKNLRHIVPELYLISATIYYWVLTANILNPIAIILLIILCYQIVFQNLKIGLIIASLFILLNMYMVLALISELSEFSEPNNAFTQLLIFGSLFLGLNLIVAVLMLIKYIKKNIQITN